MDNTRKIRPRLRAVLALGAVALMAFAGLAVAKDRGGDRADATGTITAFDTSSDELTIETNAGESFTARVSGRTKVRCEDQRGRDRHGSGSRRESGSGSGEDNGGRGGEDNGGRGEIEPGDDNGGDRSRGDHDDGGVGARCGSDDLLAGASVHEAELELHHGEAGWDEIELTRSR